MQHNSLERIARLEEKNENLEARMDARDDHLDKLIDEVRGIRIRLEKSISFIGGISFTFSMFGAAMGAVIMYTLRKMGIEV